MKIEPIQIIFAIAAGIGATFFLDLWSLFLKRAINLPTPNYCLVGRWLLYMPEGTFKHKSISATPNKDSECTVGWSAHYLIGITFAAAFVALAGNNWLQHPTLIPAIVFGVVTVSAPFFIIQPAFGLGFAASKAPNPS